VGDGAVLGVTRSTASFYIPASVDAIEYCTSRRGIVRKYDLISYGLRSDQWLLFYQCLDAASRPTLVWWSRLAAPTDPPRKRSIDREMGYITRTRIHRREWNFICEREHRAASGVAAADGRFRASRLAVYAEALFWNRLLLVPSHKSYTLLRQSRHLVYSSAGLCRSLCSAVLPSMKCWCST